jgi:DNA polymerase-3 subunit epsilon
VLLASDAELAAHEAALVQIDKASGGKTVWRTA